MARTDLRVTIDADAAKLDRELKRAARSMDQLDREISKGNRTAEQFEKQLNQRTAQALQNLGRGMVTFGAATLAGLGLATKAALDWETAWTGVLKTVDGTPEQLAALEAGLRDLATELPASHAQIAAVAEAAGQLGVATPDVVEFTRVMVNLGETTNLTAEEAATSIAQLMNVMQTAPEDVGRLGAALVELGNNGASTERDIIEMAQRIAGAGQIIGLAEHEVLAIANALASVGIEAEAGGTAISTTMTKIASAVAEGGDAVTGFADVAGMSAQEFATAFETNPAQAINSFVLGLGRINESGGNVFATLDDLGLGTIRTRDALLRLSGAGDLLTQSFADGARAWEENTALIEEAEKRYDTAEAKIQIAKNTLVDLAIDIGGVILPAVSSLAEGAASLGKFFGDLPGPVKTLATILAGLVGAASLAGGTFLLLAPRIAAARVEMQLLAATRPGISGALGAIGRAAGIAGGIVAAAGAIEMLHRATVEAGTGIGEMTEALLNLRKGQVDEAIGRLVEKRDALADRNVWLDIVGGLGGVLSLRHDADELGNELESVDQALVSMVQGGHAEEAADAVRALGEQMGLSGAQLDSWVERRLPGYTDELANARNESELTGDATDDLGAEFGALEQAIADAEQALSDYADEQRKATDPVFAMISALDDVEDAQSAYNDAVEEFGEKSPEAERAALDLAGAVADAEQAALNGDLAYDEFRAKLRQWVSQGVLTAGQADIIAGRVDEARKSAEDYEGDYAAELRAETERAVANVEKLRAKIAEIKSRTVTITARTVASGPSSILAGFKNATGGLISGPGTGTSDSIVARVSDGEYVVRAAAVDKYGPAMLDAINSMRFASGGMVGPRMASPSAAGAGHGVNVENLNVQAWTDRFSLRQVEDELAMHGAA